MPRVRFDRLCVLLLDDNRHMLRLMEEILRAIGIRNVIAVTDAAEAFREMRIAPVDLAIVDWEMTPLSGPEFVKLVRTAKDSPNVFVPIIMLTAHTQMANVVEARDTGINDFLAKPVSPKSVLRRIVSVIGRPRPFVRTKTYFGPDRRRRQLPFKGPGRRKEDVVADEDGLSQDQVEALLNG